VYGINYVIDPSSSYIDMSENASSLDTLNYPYQTLYYRGGDCDDLSILFCSMLEVLGIDTAFITIPGHIYMAFDSGLTGDEGREQFFIPEDLIYYEGKAWVPLEITLNSAPFYQAWRVGARQWRNAEADRNFFPMKESWALYKPVSVSDAAGKMPELPDEDSLISVIEESLDTYIGFRIRPRTRELKGQIAASSSGNAAIVRRNDLGGLYGMTGMLLDAETELSRIQGTASAAVNLGNIAFVRGQYDDAEKLYRESLRREPENVLARLGLARTRYEQGDYLGAEAEYRSLQNADSDLAGLYPYLGTWRETLGQPLSYSDRLVTTHWIKTDWQMETERIAEAARLAAVSSAVTRPVTASPAAAAASGLATTPAAVSPAGAAEPSGLAKAPAEASPAVAVEPSGLTATPAEQEAEFPVLPAFYRIVLGDTLIRLAQRDYIYGDWTKWWNLYKANEDKFPQRDNPDLILPGMILRIPSLNGEERRGVR
jgi:nucleoid-associated protein YgaU